MESQDHINREPEAPTGPGPTEQEAEQDLPPGYAERSGDSGNEEEVETGAPGNDPA
jgi:hypothetical protein